MSIKISNLIIDWDGTVCNSIPHSFRATCSIFSQCNLPPPTIEEYLTHQKPPFVEFYYERGVPRSVSVDQIWEWYLAAANHHANTLFQDTIPVVTKLRKNGANVILVTCQTAATVNHILSTHYCPHLFTMMFCEAMPDKVPFLNAACRQLRVQPSNVYAVGDTVGDMVAAKAAGLIPIGIVRNGVNISKVLTRAGAARVINSLYDLMTII